MNVGIEVTNKNGTTFQENKVLSFEFRKDAYLPYSLLRIRLTGSSADYSDATAVKLRIGGFTPHYGLIDSITTETSGGNTVVNIVSRGFTSLLCQNQIEPGLKTGVSVNSLMNSFYNFPNVTWEHSSDTGYIYVRPNTSMWDALSNLAYKLYGVYPYIRGQNQIRTSPALTPRTFVYTDDQLIAKGSRLLGRRLISNFHMADINGDYGYYELTDTDVTDMGIVRHSFFDLDMRFLRDPQDALVYRDKFACRAWKQVFCKRSGYHGEDLSDIISFGSVCAERISAVTVTGNSSGIITESSVYHDKFPHTQ